MKIQHFLFSFLLFFSCIFLKGQTNLVPNGSFENYTVCPNDVGDFTGITNWWASLNTPDYFSACGDECVFVPYNASGFQYPYDGNAYIGISTISSDYIGAATYRECISSKLTMPLSVGVKYNFSMQVSRADSYSVPLYDSSGGGCNSPTNCATNKIGALFTVNKYDNINSISVNNFAHIYSDSVIIDTASWTRISGSFIADSAYEYINLGNFFDDANTDSLYITHNSGNPQSCRGYYYVDSVSLYSDNLSIINNNILQENVIIFPNPIQSNCFFIKSFYSLKSVVVYTQLGKIMESKLILFDDEISKIMINDEIDKGIYILELVSQNKVFHYSLIKI